MGTDRTHLRTGRLSPMNDLAQEKGDRILRHGAHGAARRDEKASPTWSQRQSPVEIDAKGTNRAKKQVIIQARRKIRQGLDQEGARDGTRERLRLGHEFRNIGETGITTNKGNNT